MDPSRSCSYKAQSENRLKHKYAKIVISRGGILACLSRHKPSCRATRRGEVSRLLLRLLPHPLA